jgi:hypothetical protein
MKIYKNKKPKLKLPTFTVDGELSKKLNDYEITKLMNKSNVSLFLGKAGSGKTSLMTSFLKTPELFYRVYHNIYLFMPPNSRASLKDNFFDKRIPEEQIYDTLDYENLDEVFNIIQSNADENYLSLIIFDDVQKYLKDNAIQKLLLNIINNRRHLKTSLFFCCQNYISIPRMIRQGLTDLFVFKINKTEMENIFLEQFEQYKDDFTKIMKLCYNEPHNFLYINTNSQRLFKNWDEIIITNNDTS